LRAVLRIFLVIPIGFIAACIAAGLFFVTAVIGFGPGGSYFSTYLGETAVLAAGVSLAAGAFAAIPAGIAILLAEVFGWRSLLFYVVVGAGAGLWAGAAAHAALGIDTDVGVEIYAATGCISGFVYWLIAGRDAGIAVPPASP
jgi:hypothetical protein